MRSTFVACLFASSVFFLSSCGLRPASTESVTAERTGDTIRGLYKAVLSHNNGKFYQLADITLRTSNPSGQIKIAANVKLYFGDRMSPEYFTYEYPDVPYNLLTGEINIVSDENDISIIGKLQEGMIEGEWFSQINGLVGDVIAKKPDEPKPADGLQIVKPLSGQYRGTLTNNNPRVNLPKNITTTFVSTQENSGTTTQIKITGKARFYLGPIGSTEYVETEFSDIQFNYNSRFLTAKTRDYNITFKGLVMQDGQFKGTVFHDAEGEIGPFALSRGQ